MALETLTIVGMCVLCGSLALQEAVLRVEPWRRSPGRSCSDHRPQVLSPKLPWKSDGGSSMTEVADAGEGKDDPTERLSEPRDGVV